LATENHSGGERMQSIEEAELPNRLLNHDEQVLEDILRLYGGPILSLLKRRFQGVLVIEDLEDVLSIALYRVWKARSRYDVDKASLKVWLYRVAENTARDVLRAGWQKSKTLEVLQHDDVMSLASVSGSNNRPVPPGQTDGSPATRKQPVPIHMDLREIIAELPEKQRRIILADASARDDVACSRWLAVELGTSPGNVRVYRKRAMDKIRTELGRRGHAPH
jgi:RNA polymerase sigma-70 factor, ECF subfamily